MILGELESRDLEIKVAAESFKIEGRFRNLDEQSSIIKWTLTEETYFMMPSRVFLLNLD